MTKPDRNHPWNRAARRGKENRQKQEREGKAKEFGCGHPGQTGTGHPGLCEPCQKKADA
ncbi:MAG: hypothetical protein ACYTAF_17470 [Planctomycetota bacterium]|jgi:hypothetical protein